MVVLWIVAVGCGRGAPDRASVLPGADAAPPGPPALTVDVEIVLDPGRVQDGAWVSTGPADALVEPAAAQHGDRAVARLPVGAASAVVRRACGEVRIPYRVDPAAPVVSLPYPTCDQPVPDGAWTPEDADLLRSLDLFPEWPASAGPRAVWVTWPEAASACAWYGRALAPAGEGPSWLPDGTLSGADWVAPSTARDHAIGLACAGP